MIARCESYKDRVYRTAQQFIQQHSAEYLTDHSPLLQRTTEYLEETLLAPKCLAQQAVEWAAKNLGLNDEAHGI